MNSQDYIEVSVKITPFSDEKAEIVEAMVSDLPYDSFMTEDPYLRCYIRKDAYKPQDLKVILSGLDFDTSFSASLIPSTNWNKEWESSFKPITVDGKVTISIPGPYSKRRTRFNMKLRPEMAFGTGYHETTYMMVRGMLRNEDTIRGGIVLDMGCGTGILGILAAKMKAAKVYAIDIDGVAAKSAFNNAILNRVSRHIETYCGDASLLQSGKYDVILANIHRNVIIEDLRTYAGALRPGGLLLTSGYYSDGPDGTGDSSDIRKEAAANGLSPEFSDNMGGWACTYFRK